MSSNSRRRNHSFDRVAKPFRERRLEVEQLETRYVLSSDLAEVICANVPHSKIGTSPARLQEAPDSTIEWNLSSASFDSAQAAGGPRPSFDPNTVFSLHSYPTATKTIYLDFNGHQAMNTWWNRDYNLPVISTAPYSIDENPAFSDTELYYMYIMFNKVSEFFSPFNVDVTTEEPSQSDLLNTGDGDDRWGTRVAIGESNHPISFVAGGVAYLSDFGSPRIAFSGVDNPAYVFPSQVANRMSWVAELTAHEVGHTLGLEHDGRSTPQENYYEGHTNDSAATSWAPIMGSSYDKYMVQWSKGEYASANNQQDDLAIITSRPGNGFGYRPDDFGNDSASALPIEGRYELFNRFTMEQYGVIEQREDTDWFALDLDVGPIDIQVTGGPFWSMLDTELSLYNSSGKLEAIDNFGASATASLTGTISIPGRYYIKIDGVGKGDPLGNGYSDYGSLGQYKIAGTYVWKDDHSNDPASATSVNVPSTTPGNLELAFDQDFFKFSAVFGGTYTWATTSAENTATSLEIYAADGTTQLASSGLLSSVSWTAPQNGDFFLKVSSREILGKGKYNLVATSVLPINRAPVLNPGLTPSLGAKETNPLQPTGVSVAALRAGTSDADFVVRGIAIISAPSGAQGTWEYQPISGVVWQPFGFSPTASRALLLDENAVIRFVPSPTFNGQLRLAYRAWDGTQGVTYETFDLSLPASRGGNTAFSSAVANAFSIFADGTAGNDTIEIEPALNAAGRPIPKRATLTVNGTSRVVVANGLLVVRGFGGNDTIAVSPAWKLNTRLYGHGGNDNITGGGGDDVIDGGVGINFADPSDGTDQLINVQGVKLYGTSGNDRIVINWYTNHEHGEEVLDTFEHHADFLVANINDRKFEMIYNPEDNGESPTVVVYAGDGDDTVIMSDDGAGQHWNAEFYGGNGNDVLVGASLLFHKPRGNDKLYGGDGDDILLGNAGNDYLHGGAGNDRLEGSTGVNVLYGSEGNDVLIAGDGGNELFGNEGNDVLRAGDGNDYLSGGDGDDYLNAGEGSNSLWGGAGADQLIAGAGVDVLYGGDGPDVLQAGDGNNQLYGDAGNDRLVARAGNDLLRGGDDDDYLEAGEGDNTLYGDSGNDRLIAGRGQDSLLGGEGDDYLDAGQGNNRLWGGNGIDWLFAGLGNDVLYGGAGDDRLDAGSGDNYLYGESGDDILTAGVGRDILRGGTGNDFVDAGRGNNDLYGDEGDDWLLAGNGDDLLVGGLGLDRLDGGEGRNRLEQ